MSTAFLLNLALPCHVAQAQLERPAPPPHPGPVRSPRPDRAGHAGPHPDGAPSITGSESVGYSFCPESGCADGKTSDSMLTAAADGNFYGTAISGGTTSGGVIFRITPLAQYSVVYTFCMVSGCLDGKEPNNTLIQDEHGNLWGTTEEGGASNHGTIFKLAPDGTYTKVYDFCSLASCADGAYPYGSGLMEGSDGNFYGETYEYGPASYGVAYKITPAGQLTVIHAFSSLPSYADGYYPYGDLLQGSDGKLYGWTYEGGLYDGGVLFSMDADGSNFTTLYAFCSQTDCTDGSYPYYGNLTEASDGNYYGVTYEGGANNSGEVFSISPGGTYTQIYSMCSISGCLDGYDQYIGTLALGSDGNFYGVSDYGGANDEGLLFQITTTGTLTPVYSFCSLSGCADGEKPDGNLAQMEDGTFYGSTYAGGANNDGALYGVTMTPSIPGPLQMSFEQGSINVGQTDSFEWFSSNSFSTTMQQCNAFAYNTSIGTLYPLGPVSGTLTNGSYGGIFTTAAAPTAGLYLVSVTCGGTETVYTEVDVEQIGTTVTLTPTVSPLVSGQTETFNVSVTAADSSTVNEGTVVLACNGAHTAPIPVVAGAVTLPVNTATVAADTYDCSATYSDGDRKYAQGSGTSNITATSQTTSVALTPASGTLRQGNTVTLTATLSGQYFTPNSGTVTFSSLGWSQTVPVDYATGTASTSPTLDIPTGSYTVTAPYSGARGAQGSSTQQTYTVDPPCSVAGRGPHPAC
jgi:uncharacterized repeat protein (TIGR03803 family)